MELCRPQPTRLQRRHGTRAWQVSVVAWGGVDEQIESAARLIDRDKIGTLFAVRLTSILAGATRLNYTWTRPVVFVQRTVQGCWLVFSCVSFIAHMLHTAPASARCTASMFACLGICQKRQLQLW